MKLFRTFKNRRKISNVTDPAERYVALQLEQCFSAREYGIFHNVLIPYSDRIATSQIDHLIVSVYGIFCIETKRHRGWIAAYKAQKLFKQILSRSFIIRPNPVYQNQRHVRSLQELLGKNIKVPIVNIVVFPYANRFTIEGYENVGSVSDMHEVIRRTRKKVYRYEEAKHIIELINKANMKYPEAHAYHAHAVKAVHAH